VPPVKLWTPSKRQAQEVFRRYGVNRLSAHNGAYLETLHSYFVYPGLFNNGPRITALQASIWHRVDHWEVNLWVDGHCTTSMGCYCATFHGAVKKAKELLLGLDAVRRLTGGVER